MELFIVLGVLFAVLLGLFIRLEMFFAKTYSSSSAAALASVSIQKDLTYIKTSQDKALEDLSTSLKEERAKVLSLTKQIVEEQTKNKLLEESMEVFTSTLSRR